MIVFCTNCFYNELINQLCWLIQQTALFYIFNDQPLKLDNFKLKLLLFVEIF